MEAVIKALAEGQQQLQQLVQVQGHQAQADRQALQQALQVQTAAQEQGREALRILGESVAAHRTHPAIPPTVLQKYQAGDDPSFFFVNFERIARAAQWPQDRWSFFLAPLLMGVMQGAYQAANPNGDTPYVDIKKSILERLGMDEESYRLQFRETRLKPGESPRQLFYWIQDLTEKWLQTNTATIGQIKEKIMLEQFIEALPGPIQRWVRQHHRWKLSEAIDVATAYQKAGIPRSVAAPTAKHYYDLPALRSNHRGSAPEPRVRQEPKATNGTNLTKGQVPQCFECGEWGHIARFCAKRNKTEPMEIGTLQPQGNRRRLPYVIEVTVDGHPQQAMMDSGSRQTAIQPHVSEQDPGQEWKATAGVDSEWEETSSQDRWAY
ncbi:uncharacterized protein [Ambystoma mexicanum]|uniref:uncharacterized protein isoform X2 n=1 Tax=Ambystoma mexicanum TaxID=8296 RepID=UPI0037E985BE